MTHSESAPALHPEAELLLYCARTCMDAERAERMRALLQGDIDWPYLTRMAQPHGLMPLLYWNLHTTCPKSVPEAVLHQLRRHFDINDFRNRFLTKELFKLLKLFETHDVLAVPYKGPALAAAAYGNLSLRQFSDLDILIHKRDIPKAKGLLLSNGYRSQLSETQEAVQLCSHYHWGFVRTHGEICVELHWAFTREYWDFPLDLDRLAERLTPVSFAGSTVLHFSPEDLLLILCVHGAKDCWDRLRWICDVAELIRGQQGLAWEKLLMQADRLRCRRILFLGLFLAKDLLGAPLPAEVWQKVQSEPVVPALAAQVREGLFTGADCITEDHDRYAFYLRMRERLPDRLRYFYYDHLRGYLRAFPTLMIPSAKDRALLSLPASLTFLYYPLRPIRLIGEHGLKFVRILLKNLAGF